MEKIIEDLKSLGLPIVRVWWQKDPGGQTLQFEFTRPLTEEELEVFENYRKTL